MNHGKFLQFNSGPDWFSQARLVYFEKPPVAPQPAPEGETAAAQRTEGKAAEPGGAGAARETAKQRQTALREQSAEAREAGEKEREAAAAQAETHLENTLDTDETPAGIIQEETAGEIPAAAPGAGSERAENTSEEPSLFDNLMRISRQINPEKAEKYKDKIRAAFEGLTYDQAGQGMRKLFDSFTGTERSDFFTCLATPISTDDQQKARKTYYGEDGKLKLDTVQKFLDQPHKEDFLRDFAALIAIASQEDLQILANQKNITPIEVVSIRLTLYVNHTIEDPTINIDIAQMVQQVVTDEKAPVRTAETADTISASEADVRTLTQKYEKMRGTKSDEEITNTITEDSAMRADFAIIHWAEQPIVAAEIDAALAKAREELKSAWAAANPAIAADSLPTPEEIDELAASGKLDFREAKALREHLKKQVVDGESLPRLTGDALEKFKKAMGIKEKEWWKGATEGGFWGAIGATLKKLFDKLTDLAERIGKWFSEQFGGEEETKTEKGKLTPFPTSPIAGTEKFEMRDSTQGGVDLIADSSGKQVVSVGPEGGKITEKNNAQGKIAIQHGKTRIVYTGLNFDSNLAKKTVGDEIPKGAVLGTMKTNTLNFQMLNEQGQQIPQTQIKDLLASYAKPAETETQTGTSPETGTQKATAGAPAEGTAGAKIPEATPAPADTGAAEAAPAAAPQTAAPGPTPAAPAR